MASHAERDFLRSIKGYLGPDLWKPAVAQPVLSDGEGWK